MSLASIQARGRAAAEARMPSRCIVRRKTGNKITVPESGLRYDEWAEIYTDLPVRIAGQASGAEVTAGKNIPGGMVQVARKAAHFPAATDNLRDGDHIEITSGETAELVFKLLEADWADQKTARRVPVEAVQRPEEWDL